jgi:uncharacterized protein GlcG (DUF336 family)
VKLEHAQRIIAAALAQARARGLLPLTVVVLKQRGALKAAAAADGCSLKGSDIARSKARGALARGLGSRRLAKRAETQPHFAAVTHAVGGALIPVPGGVLMRDSAGMLLGAVGISGDTSDNAEAPRRHHRLGTARRSRSVRLHA